MLYRGKYEVNSADIVDGTINWKTTGNGAFIIAEYNGARYFVKRFTMGPRNPDKSLPEPAYSMQKAAADWLENKQKEIRKRFKGLSTDADHIVIEEENFWDENMFTTVTKLIPDEAKDFDFTSLDFNAFKKLCRDTATLLAKAHDAGVTHGDLKVKNILFQRKGSNLIPYLIDFDSSYPSDYCTKKKSDGTDMIASPSSGTVVFSPGYQSPEIAIYNYNYDAGLDGDASAITNKTDIFTLAIIFHELWAGCRPVIVGDNCPLGEAIYMGTPIKLDTKFNVSFGSNHDSKFSSLLMWMLDKDHTKRPTAQEVIDVLDDRLEVDDQYEVGEAVAKFDLNPHEIHKMSLEIHSRDVLKANGVKKFGKIIDGGLYKYAVKLKDGTELKLTVDEVIARGYGKAKTISVCELWDDDAKTIEFLPADELEKQGVQLIERQQVGFKKYYRILYRSGRSNSTSGQGLKVNGLAREKAPAPDSGSSEPQIILDGPWPEHGSGYNEAALKSRDITEVQKYDANGDHCYLITIKTDSGDEKKSIVKVGYMRLMKFIVQ